MSRKLSVLTLNCWGLPDVITRRVYAKVHAIETLKNQNEVKKKQPEDVMIKETTNEGIQGVQSKTVRMARIASTLYKYDIVTLQEMWQPHDRETLRKAAAAAGLSFSHTFDSGILGSSGLQIFARFPIVEACFYRYRINGQVTRVDQMDYHVGKGFGVVRLDLGQGQSAAVVTTHTIAQYDTPDPYVSDRLTQIFDLGRWIRDHLGRDHLVLVTGDFNFQPCSLEYRFFRELTGLSDAHVEANLKGDYDLAMVDTPEGRAAAGGHTLVDSNLDDEIKRLDYILYHTEQRDSCAWHVDSAKVTCTHDDFFYSDHMGVAAEFSWRPVTTGELDFSHAILPVDVSCPSGREAFEMLQRGLDETKNRAYWYAGRSFIGVLLWFAIHFYGMRNSVPLLLVDLLVIYVVFQLYTLVVVVRDELASRLQTASELEFFAARRRKSD